MVGTSFIVVHHCIDGELIPHWITGRSSTCDGHTNHHQEPGFNPLTCHDDYLPAFQRIANVFSAGSDLEILPEQDGGQPVPAVQGKIWDLLLSGKLAATAAPFSGYDGVGLAGADGRLWVFLCCLLR